MIKRNYLLWIGALVVIFWIFYYSFSTEGLDPNYSDRVTQERKEKDLSLVRDPKSPFKDKEFEGLQYFPVDPKYRVQAGIEPLEQQDRIFLETNDGEYQTYQRFAKARFTIEQKRQELVILRPYPVQEQDLFFLPFGDATSGLETYGAGRYLDLRFKPGSSRIEIDFNLAYNPFCAYDVSFSCPLPPAENLLPIPIYAGEKNYD